MTGAACPAWSRACRGALEVHEHPPSGPRASGAAIRTARLVQQRRRRRGHPADQFDDRWLCRFGHARIVPRAAASCQSSGRCRPAADPAREPLARLPGRLRRRRVHARRPHRRKRSCRPPRPLRTHCGSPSLGLLSVLPSGNEAWFKRGYHGRRGILPRSWESGRMPLPRCDPARGNPEPCRKGDPCSPEGTYGKSLTPYLRGIVPDALFSLW